MPREDRKHLISILDKTIELAQAAQKEKQSKQETIHGILDEDEDAEDLNKIWRINNEEI